MSIPIGRAGDLGLHIISVDDMPRAVWCEGFKNDEEVEFALKDANGFIARLGHRAGYVRELLSDLLKHGGLESSPKTATAREVKKVSNDGHILSITTNIIRPDVIMTDSGKFGSLPALVINLGKLFPLSSEEDIVECIYSVKQRMSLSQEITYLSMPVYTEVIIKAKKLLDDDVIRLLGGEVPVPIEDVSQDEVVIEEYHPLKGMPLSFSHGQYGIICSNDDVIMNFLTYKEAMTAQKIWNASGRDKVKARKLK